MRLVQSHSDFLNAARIVATASVVFGHFMHFGLVDLWLPTIGRASMPLFLMMAGYFAAYSLRRADGSALAFIARRFYGLWFLLVPAVLLTTVFGTYGYAVAPEIYGEKFVAITSFAQFAAELAKTLTFTGEFWFGIGAQGFAGNEALWTLFYIMPFTAMLAIAIKARGVRRAVGVALIALACGPFVLLLAPLFFAGTLAYLIHERF